jgi:hypothetical protein
VGLPLSQDEAASEQAADGIADGKAANVGVQGLILVLEEFMTLEEVAHRDHLLEGYNDSKICPYLDTGYTEPNV